jgi:hypothetical protein
MRKVMRLTPVPQRSVGVQRALSAADQAKAERLSREMALYARLTGGTSTAPAKSALTPGTPAFAQAARKDYADLLELYGAPKLSPSFVVKNPETLPQPVLDTFEAFKRQHAGRAEIALSSIDGHRTWQAQVVNGTSAQVLLVDAKGQDLGRGVVQGAAVKWR